MGYNSIYNFIGLQREIKRLKTQANLGFEKEFRTLKWLGLQDGMNIIDIGAGPGFYTELLLENLPNSPCTALEIDKSLMDIAKTRLERYSDRVNYIESSLFNNNIEDNTYDFVICRFVFQHLEEPSIAAREIYRILKPGGIVAIIDSDRGMWGITEPDILIKNGLGIMRQIEKSTRWNREIGRYLLKILKENGFNNLDFEAVTIHSDLVGIKNIVGDFNITNEQYKMIMNLNPKLARMIKACREITNSEKSIVIFLNLIAKGIKPLN